MSNLMDVTAAGNIEQTEGNIRRIALISDELKKVLAGSEYREAVRAFLGSIDEGVQLTNEIAQTFESSFEPTEVQKQLLQLSKQNAINTFFGAGLDARFTQPFLEQLYTNYSCYLSTIYVILAAAAASGGAAWCRCPGVPRRRLWAWWRG